MTGSIGIELENAAVDALARRLWRLVDVVEGAGDVEGRYRVWIRLHLEDRIDLDTDILQSSLDSKREIRAELFAHIEAMARVLLGAGEEFVALPGVEPCNLDRFIES